MRLTFKFLYYDFWIGVFYDRAKRVVYVCPLPCLVFKWDLSRDFNKKAATEDRLRESVHKGGVNGPTQIQTRPAPPAPMQRVTCGREAMTPGYYPCGRRPHADGPCAHRPVISTAST